MAKRPGGLTAVNKAISICNKANKRKTCERAIRGAATKLWKKKKSKARKTSYYNRKPSKRAQNVTAGITGLFG